MALNLDPTRRSSGPSCVAQPLPKSEGTVSPEPVRDSLTKSPKNIESPHSCLSLIWNAVCSLFRRLFFCFAPSSQGKEEKEIPVQPFQENVGSSPPSQGTIPANYFLGEDGKLYRRTAHCNFIEDSSDPSEGENSVPPPRTRAIPPDYFLGKDGMLYRNTSRVDLREDQGSTPPPIPQRDVSFSKEDRPYEINYDPDFALPLPANEGKNTKKRPLPLIPSGVVPFGAQPVVGTQNKTG